MSLTNQIRNFSALEKALLPSPLLVDGRTDVDHLSDMVHFASLFNFYDKSNNLNGDWSPFLLKDPVFLLAHISKTPFKKIHTLFLNTAKNLEQSIIEEARLSKTSEATTLLEKVQISISNGFNQLFDQLIHIFQLLERWSFFISENEKEFNLKTYLLTQITEKYSVWLWCVLNLKQEIATNKCIPNISLVHYGMFKQYNFKIWKENKTKYSFYDLFGLDTDFENNSIELILKSIKDVGNQLLSFFSNIIVVASEAIKNTAVQSQSSPDTLLLRAITKLLEAYKSHMNGFSNKHLDFYYKEILKQHKNSAKADKVFVGISLSEQETVFKLPKATFFNAGLDAEKNSILFKNEEEVSLNKAQVSKAYTLCKSKLTTNNNITEALCLQEISNPSSVIKNTQDVVQTWNTFGAETTAAVTQSIVIASPLLYLQEGDRKITMTFSLQETISFDWISNASFFLSSAKGWFQVSKANKTLEVTTPSCELKLTITLAHGDPAIKKYIDPILIEQPKWPMLKIVFTDFEALSSSPQINSLNINVTASKLKDLVLSNNYGKLATKKPFQPFGPTPNNEESLLIGSNEIFTKHLNALSFHFQWDNLPKVPKMPKSSKLKKSKIFQYKDAFSNYYLEYNKYLTGFYEGVLKDETKSDNPNDNGWLSFFKSKKNQWQDIFEGVGNKALFNDQSFQVNFNLLQYGNWEPCYMNNPNEKGEATIVPETNSTKDGFLYYQPLYQSKNKIIDISIDKEIDAHFTLQLSAVYDFYTEQFTLSYRMDFFDENYRKQEVIKSPKFLSKSIEKSWLSIFELAENDFPSEINQFQKKIEKIVDASIELVFTNILFPTSSFSTDQLKAIQKEISPTLQNAPLAFNDNTSSGFFKMEFVGPEQGFGKDLYAKVINAIALSNAEAIAQAANRKPSNLKKTANIPYTPIVNLLTANYSASHSYDFTATSQDYPIQVFYETPFSNYLYYDSEEKNTLDNPVIGGKEPLKGTLPLYATFKSKGQLFLQIKDLIAPASLRIYIELNRVNADAIVSEKQPLSYWIGTKTGWEAIEVINDGTSGFTCSGILVLNILENCSSQMVSMPKGNYWIAIGTSQPVVQFAKTSFLCTNGVVLFRDMSGLEMEQETPSIKADVVKSTIDKIGQVSTIVQPFVSFGGKAQEQELHKNKRISVHLQTKDRLVTSSDYYRSILLKFATIFYAKAVYDRLGRKTKVFVLPKIQSWTTAHAFKPMVSECLELKIQTYLIARTSQLTSVKVCNFKFKYVKIIGEILLNKGFEKEGVATEINKGLNLFLSPWVETTQDQIMVDDGLSTAQISTFINNFDSVAQIQDLKFQLSSIDAQGNVSYENELQDTNKIASDTLLVPSLDYSLLKYKSWES